MDFPNLQDKVILLLKRELPADLLYHSVQHAIDVMQSSEAISIAEGLTGDNLTIIKTAALFHDAGFIGKYDENEELGCRIAQEILPDFGYDSGQISDVKTVIMATRIPQNPLNLLGRIICDADLDYLGTSEFEHKSELLRMELEVHGRKFTDAEWFQYEIVFISHHHYWTNTSIELREPQKKKNLEILKRQLMGLGKKKRTG